MAADPPITTGSGSCSTADLRFLHSIVRRAPHHAWRSQPGNYLFRDDGTVAIIDFGSVKAFGPELCGRILALWHAHIQGDLDQVITHYCSLSIAAGDRATAEKFYRTALAPLDEWLTLPYKEETFDFGAHEGYCARGALLFRDMVRFKEMNGFPAETVLFDRNVYGLYRIFTELKARVRMKNQWIS